MSGSPSWHNSTLSQAFLGSCVFYAGLLFLVSAGLIWFKLDVEVAKLIIGWASAFQVAISSAYLTARRTSNGNGEAKKEEPPKP